MKTATSLDENALAPSSNSGMGLIILEERLGRSVLSALAFYIVLRRPVHAESYIQHGPPRLDRIKNACCFNKIGGAIISMVK